MWIQYLRLCYKKFSKIYNLTHPHELLELLKKHNNSNPKNLEECAISLVGKKCYKKLIKGYTEKQWMKSAKQLPKEIIERLPVRLTYDNNYFNDKYQGIPVEGYTKIFKKFIDAGYRRESYPVDASGNKDNKQIQFLRDYFYPNFRNLMFLRDNEDETFRYIKLDNQTVSLIYGRNERRRIYSIGIHKSELYLFKEQIGLFSISIEIQEANKNLDDISNIISIVKNFDAELENGNIGISAENGLELKEAQNQELFMHNVGLIGGLFIILANGSGKYSIKKILARPKK